MGRMQRAPFRGVDDYIGAQPDSSRELLELVREALLRALPGAEESISYDIPAYKIDGKIVLYFAGWKRHFSLYAASEGVKAEFHDELARYEVRNGTIKFPLDQPPPLKLISRIAKFQAKEATAKKRGRAGAA
jgi:uncharacterized protein YdhG (YjbR/CyaY superfamily)